MKERVVVKRICGVFVATLFCATAGIAQSGPSLPLPDQAFHGTVGATFRDSTRPTLPHPVRAPQGAPNIVVIMLDDAGFAQYSTWGGAVASPTMDELARDGLRYNRFHTAGICSPTRAALLTGRNPHNAGVGIVTELSNGYDGYTGIIPQSTVPVARVLRDNGYATAMFGKNHNTPTVETGSSGPFNHWPNALGFDYFYGFNAWGTSQWEPLLFENTRPVPPSTDPDYQLTGDLADRAIEWVHSAKSANPDRPFFLYIATGATHAPHHAPRAWIERFRGKFDQGWDRYREEAFARQKRLGVIPADAELTPRPAALPAWESLSPEGKRIAARQMEVFAGFAAYADHEMKRVVDAVRALPDGANTMIVYIAGDNGASAEGAQSGTLNEMAPANGIEAQAHPTTESLARLGGPEYMNNYPAGWAWAMNTPFRYYKQVVSHLGAIRNPMVVSWPARIKATGGLRTQFADVTDIAPTLLEAAHLAEPASVDGVAQKPLDGVSLFPTFDDPKAPEVRTRQYFEVFGNRAIYDHGWMASARLADPWLAERAQLDPAKVQWELYDLSKDFTQSRDLAASDPQRLEQMKAIWWDEAKRNNVLPLDWRAGERVAGLASPNGKTVFTFYPGMVDLPEAVAPNIRNRSWTITASGSFTPADHGVLIAQGGRGGGWAIRLDAGRVELDYNYGSIAHYAVRTERPVPAGTSEIAVRFLADPREKAGQGGVVTILANGREIGRGSLPHTLPGVFSLAEGMDVGADYGSPAGAYPVPSTFSGKLGKVVVDVTP